MSAPTIECKTLKVLLAWIGGRSLSGEFAINNDSQDRAPPSASLDFSDVRMLDLRNKVLRKYRAGQRDCYTVGLRFRFGRWRYAATRSTAVSSSFVSTTSGSKSGSPHSRSSLCCS